MQAYVSRGLNSKFRSICRVILTIPKQFSATLISLKISPCFFAGNMPKSEGIMQLGQTRVQGFYG